VAYRNKTYIIFDADNDYWSYKYMLGWKSSENHDFSFHDAHDLGSALTDRASEDTVKRTLRSRFSSAKQAIVLVGSKTRNLYRFVRWEVEVALDLDLPIVAVHLQQCPDWYNAEHVPPILSGEYSVHVPYKMRIIQLALDEFPAQYASRNPGAVGPLFYPRAIYQRLGLDECA
jgi:hypothetical protein